MKAPETPIPHEPCEPMCNNLAWYEVFGTYEELMAYKMRLEQERQDRRYSELMRDLDLIQGENDYKL